MYQPQPALQYGSVCSGIEAVSLAWRPLGLEPAWFSEIAPFPKAVLAYRYPEVPNLGDMTGIARQIRVGDVPAPDILVGGTPCQSFSVAGMRQGLADIRGALTLAYVELANAIDQTRIESSRPAATLVWENVPGVLSDRANAFGCFLGALAGEDCALEPPGGKWTYAGCVSGPRRRIAWRVLNAQHHGVAQRRRRVFLVASGRDELDPATVLFEFDRVPGHSAAGIETRQDAAAPAVSGAVATGRPDGLKSSGKCAFCFGGGNTQGPIDVAACLLSAGPRNDFEGETFCMEMERGAPVTAVPSAYSAVAFTQNLSGELRLGACHGQRVGTILTTGGKSGQGRPMIACVPAIAFAQNSRDELRLESGHGQLIGALSTGGGKPGQGRPMIASVALRGREGGTTAELGGEFSPALRASSEGGDKGHVLAPDGTQWRVRRLMPVECERLQGLPDDYTQVPFRGKPAADTPRYTAIGNSMAAPCLAWLGRRLEQALRESGIA
jgi:DNA (cytosine-5)-methyltransferase 1